MQKKNNKYLHQSKIDLDMDFDTCVYNNLDECQYITNSDPNLYGGHRSLIAQFCGHEKVSDLENSPKRLATRVKHYIGTYSDNQIEFQLVLIKLSLEKGLYQND